MPRKAAPQSDTGPRGPHVLQVRVNDLVVFQQRVHAYGIDQQADQVVVTGSLRPADPVEPVPAEAPEPDDAA